MEEKKYTYSYSAKQQDEIRRIQQKYVPQKEDKLEQLYKLDKKATQMGTIIAIMIGIVSTLVLGFGMTCIMLWNDSLFVIGLIFGILGLIGIGSAYPIYNLITKKNREKFAPQIIKLTEELMLME